MNKKALTLLEVLISVIILALVITGLVNVIVAGKWLMQRSRFRMSAGEIGKKFIDPLQAYVREDTWTSNPLGNLSMSIPQATNGIYIANYTVANHPGDADIKKVKIIVSWTE